MTDFTSNFPGNTNKGKEENKPPREEKVIERLDIGKVVIKKKSVGKKFKELFVRGDLKTMARYVGADVITPALRILFLDIVTKGAERLFMGDSQYRYRRPQDYSYRPSVQYNMSSIHRRDPREFRDARNPSTMLPDQPPYSRARRMQEPDEIIVQSRQYAEMIVERLKDYIELYDVATVADLREMLGFPSPFTDHNWGWTSLPSVEIRQVREGYLLNLPPVEAI